MNRRLKAAAVTAAFYAVCAFPLWGPADLADGAKSTLLVLLALWVGGGMYHELLAASD